MSVKDPVHDAADDDPDNMPIARVSIRVGIGIVGIFVGVLGVWSATAPIGAAAIAMGTLVVDFNRKTIQHFEGGIIDAIHVKEGQSVVTGTPLLVLRDIRAKAKNELIVKQLMTAKVVERRLMAERDNLPTLNLDDLPHLGSHNVDLGAIIVTQQDLFIARNNTLENQHRILTNRIDQLNNEIRGLTAQRRATQTQISIVEKEATMMTQLVRRQNAPLTHQMALEKQQAELSGRLGELDAQIAKAGQVILETQLEIITLDYDVRNQVLTDLQDTEMTISDLTEQFTSANDILKRTVITAPISGVVMNIQYHTIGAVVQPAADIMNIVPQDDQIIVEARVRPDDIDTVREGLTAKVQLVAYKSKRVPKLTGTVKSVSPDILTDERSGMGYFLARIQLHDNEITALKTKITLNPGMPAQVFIMTGARTLLNYLFSPIIDAMYRAFRDE